MPSDIMGRARTLGVLGDAGHGEEIRLSQLMLAASIATRVKAAHENFLRSTFGGEGTPGEDFSVRGRVPKDLAPSAGRKLNLVSKVVA